MAFHDMEKFSKNLRGRTPSNCGMCPRNKFFYKQNQFNSLIPCMRNDQLEIFCKTVFNKTLLQNCKSLKSYDLGVYCILHWSLGRVHNLLGGTKELAQKRYKWWSWKRVTKCIHQIILYFYDFYFYPLHSKVFFLNKIVENYKICTKKYK